MIARVLLGLAVLVTLPEVNLRPAQVLNEGERKVQRLSVRPCHRYAPPAGPRNRPSPQRLARGQRRIRTRLIRAQRFILAGRAPVVGDPVNPNRLIPLPSGEPVRNRLKAPPGRNNGRAPRTPQASIRR
jgi:hypothetical protein